MLRRRRIRNLLAHLGPWILTPHTHMWAQITDEQLTALIPSEDEVSKLIQWLESDSLDWDAVARSRDQ